MDLDRKKIDRASLHNDVVPKMTNFDQSINIHRFSCRIVFYHRVSPKSDLDMFMYIVCVECWNVNNGNLIHMLDFVQRMRVERLNGYISLYRDLGLEEDDSNYHSGGGSQDESLGDEGDDEDNEAEEELVVTEEEADAAAGPGQQQIHDSQSRTRL
jgi:hypothetical protein